VGLYTRQQLVLLLLLLGAAGVGLGVMHWRAANPEIVKRLEQLDHEIAASDDVKGEERGDREARPPAAARALKRQVPVLGEGTPPLDLNRATLADLTRLPGVGPVMARRILEARDDVGRFGAVDDLLTVRGLGRAKLERLRPFVGVTDMGGLIDLHGGPEMAPKPPPLVAPRQSRGAPRDTPADF